MKIFQTLTILCMIVHTLLQCGVIEKTDKELVVNINNKKTTMIPLEECDDDELIDNDCSKLLLVQPNKGLFFIDEKPSEYKHFFLESLRQTNLFPRQMFCASYVEEPTNKVAIIEYSLPIDDYILDAEKDPNNEDWYKFNKLYKIALISKKVLSNVLKMLGLEQLCHNKEDQVKRFKKMMRKLKQIHKPQRELSGGKSQEVKSQHSVQESVQNQNTESNNEIDIEDDNVSQEEQLLTSEPIVCDPKLFLQKKKYIPELDIKHVGIKQDINLRLSSPEQIAEHIVFRNGHSIEALDSGKLDEFIKQSQVYELIKSVKGDEEEFEEFHNFFVLRQFFHFFQKLLHQKIFGQSTHFFDCFQDQKFFREHSRCPVFVENVLDQSDKIDKMSILYLVMDYPFVETKKVIESLNMFLDDIAIYAKNKIQKKVKQIKADLTGEVEQDQNETSNGAQDQSDDELEIDIPQDRILQQIKKSRYQEPSQFDIRGSYI